MQYRLNKTTRFSNHTIKRSVPNLLKSVNKYDEKEPVTMMNKSKQTKLDY